MIYLRAKNSKSRKPETVPLEGEQGEIIERRREVAVIREENKQPCFAEYMFHNAGEPVGASARHGQRPVLLREGREGPHVRIL